MKTADDLEARVMNRLQAMKRGQTYLSEPQGKILAVLIPLRNVRQVTRVPPSPDPAAARRLAGES